MLYIYIALCCTDGCVAEEEDKLEELQSGQLCLHLRHSRGQLGVAVVREGVPEGVDVVLDDELPGMSAQISGQGAHHHVDEVQGVGIVMRQLEVNEPTI